MAIDKAVSDSNYELFRYDLKSAVQKVCDEFGSKRVAWVLASIIQQHDYDGRYSRDNKAWANTFSIPPEQTYVCNTHPTILDDFAKRVRALPPKERKPSIIKKLEENKQSVKSGETKPTPKKENDLEV